MAEAERDTKITLVLTEYEANQLYIHLNPKYYSSSCAELKSTISAALGYEPKELPDIGI